MTFGGLRYKWRCRWDQGWRITQAKNSPHVLVYAARDDYSNYRFHSNASAQAWVQLMYPEFWVDVAKWRLMSS